MDRLVLDQEIYGHRGYVLYNAYYVSVFGGS